MPAEDRNPEEGPTAAARFGTGLGSFVVMRAFPDPVVRYRLFVRDGVLPRPTEGYSSEPQPAGLATIKGLCRYLKEQVAAIEGCTA